MSLTRHALDEQLRVNSGEPNGGELSGFFWQRMNLVRHAKSETFFVVVVVVLGFTTLLTS